MKTWKCFLAIPLSCLVLVAAGQSPKAFKYQAVARDADNKAYQNWPLTFRTFILQQKIDGPVVYAEKHQTTSSEIGIISLVIGGGETLSGQFKHIDWSAGPYFLKVEMDAEGAGDFQHMGTSELLSVPYALYALESGGDDDADPGNELQNLEQVLSIGNDAGNRRLSGLEAPQQSGDAATKGYVDNQVQNVDVRDADADPTNELQLLSIIDNNLVISPSGGDRVVKLPNSTLWEKSEGGISYKEGNVSIEKDLNVKDDLNTNGSINVLNAQGNIIGTLSSIPFNNQGYQALYGPNGNPNITLSTLQDYYNHGYLSIRGETGYLGAALYVDQNGNGCFGLRNTSEESRVRSGIFDNGSGFLETYGMNGNPNILLSNLEGNPNNGYISIYDENNERKASLYVDDSGNGVISADVKNFSLPHPRYEDKDIWYACIEGPEAAVYLRGTGQLTGGRARIDFPDHFTIVAAREGMTIQVTPHSAASKGLAVTQRNSHGFTVQELWEGRGNYAFDWEVKAVRKGYESYQVVRERPAVRGAKMENGRMLERVVEMGDVSNREK